MGILDDLQEKMQGLEREAKHEGYWYSVSGALVILVCGMLCRLQTKVKITDKTKKKRVYPVIYDKAVLDALKPIWEAFNKT